MNRGAIVSIFLASLTYVGSGIPKLENVFHLQYAIERIR